MINLNRGKLYRISGFTLIELMIVVVIIGILATIAIVQYNSAVDKAKYAQIKLKLKRIGDALQEFYAMNGCYPQDKWPDVPPDGLVPQYLEKWPVASEDPFNSVYDYDAHLHEGEWSIFITYLGKDKVNQSHTRRFPNMSPGEIARGAGDDWIIFVEREEPICAGE